MALHTFILNPSADIHLVMEPVARKSIQLGVMGYDNATGPSGSILSAVTLTIADTTIATVNAAGLLTAVKEGITFLAVEHPGTPSPFRLVARVWVHTRIFEFFPGNNKALVHVGRNDFQPTVLARFNDANGDIEDVSGHPYFSFQMANTAVATADPISGRITGVSAGNTTLTITELINNTTVGTTPLAVNVVANADRPIVEKVSFKGNGAEKRNILFLSEGFTLAERDKFKNAVKEIDSRMRTNVVHEPFKILKEDYNTWMAFDESPEAGVTIGPHVAQPFNYTINFENRQPNTPGNFTLFELIKIVGIPDATQRDSSLFDMNAAITAWTPLTGFVAARLEQDIFDAWQNTIQTGERVIARCSNLGLMYGRRLGDRFATDTNTTLADNSWYMDATSGNRDFIFNDIRRTDTRFFVRDDFMHFNNSPHLANHWTNEMFAYLTSLKRSDLPAADPNFHIGQLWGLDAQDQGLVIVIINDEIDGRNYKLMPNIFACVTLGRLGLEPNSIVGGNPIDHIPNISNFFFEALTAYVLHELCHGIFLSDEYEDIRSSGHAPSTAGMVFDEVFHNVNYVQLMNIASSKWLLLPRMAKSSAVLQDVVNGAAANTMEIVLFPGEGTKWAVGAVFVLMTKNVNINADPTINLNAYPARSRHRLNAKVPLTVTAKSGDTLTVSGGTLAAGEVFPRGSVIYFPKVVNAQPGTLFLPGVQAFLNNGTGNLPNGRIRIDRFFSDKAGNCAAPNPAMTPTPHPIPNVSIAASIKHRLVGIHEGAGTYNCGVVRASAVCKMRSEYMGGKGHFRFCHVCKYFIVQEFNPSRHAKLDEIYPGSHV